MPQNTITSFLPHIPLEQENNQQLLKISCKKTPPGSITTSKNSQINLDPFKRVKNRKIKI